MTDLEAAIAGGRLLQTAGAAALFGAPLLLRLAGTPGEAAPWLRPALVTAAVATAGGALLALAVQTASMAGSLREGLAPDSLLGVVRETGFGRSVAVRVVAGLAAGAAAARNLSPNGLAAVAAAGAAALASLAWSGHGAADEGLPGAVHLAGDMLHLLAAGAWLGALAALLGLAADASRAPARVEALEHALRAFSGVGTAVVALLVLSGLVNAWFLIGPQGWPTLLTQGWGRLLGLKLLLFAAMLALAAANRWRLTPRLAAEPGGAALGALRFSVALEAALGLGVLAAVAAMGALPPPAASA